LHSPPIALDFSIGTIGVTVKRSQGVHGDVVRATVAATTTLAERILLALVRAGDEPSSEIEI
jgi:hypothetical protein